MLTLPGLIDPHVHLRDPGQTTKEDFETGTAAAIAGGFTTIIDMPNNSIPITTAQLLEEKQKIASTKILCDTGFHFGSTGSNLEEFEKIQNQVFGLKIYLNITTGNFIIDLKAYEKICEAWPRKHPILLHAEENIIEDAIKIGERYKHKIHICHISSRKELQTVIEAKNRGAQVTCGVTPHHLFLNEKAPDTLGPFGKMKPSLKPQSEVDFLWKNISLIDIIESDHAPHTIEEKNSLTPPFGVPGLETTLPLLLTAARDKKITIEDIIRLCHTNPAKIFGIKTDPQTTILIDEAEEWTIQNEKLFTKCKWTPWNGNKVKGKIKKVILHDTKVFEDDKILITPGFGKIIC